MQYATNQYEGMIAETIVIPGHNGDPIGAYVARPLGPGPFPAIVVIHHMPGWDEWYREVTRKFAHHGYIAISPNLYHRAGHGIPEDLHGQSGSVWYLLGCPPCLFGGLSRPRICGDYQLLGWAGHNGTTRIEPCSAGGTD